MNRGTLHMTSSYICFPDTWDSRNRPNELKLQISYNCYKSDIVAAVAAMVVVTMKIMWMRELNHYWKYCWKGRGEPTDWDSIKQGAKRKISLPAVHFWIVCTFGIYHVLKVPFFIFCFHLPEYSTSTIIFSVIIHYLIPCNILIFEDIFSSFSSFMVKNTET